MRTKLFVAFLTSSVLIACNPSGNQGQNEQQKKETMKERVKKAQKVFHVIPSPVEAAIVLQKAGVNYNQNLLNSVENADKYQTLKNKAINLGIYGADLSYATVFEQTQQSLKYFSTIKQLSKDLGMDEIINSELMERVEKNVSRRDSLMSIISDVYMNANESLSEDETDYISALIIAGGWLEGLYMSTMSLENVDVNMEVHQRIAEQKYALNNLITLFELYPNQPAVKELLAGLKELKTSFEKITIERTANTLDSSKKVTKIGGKRHYQITKDIFEEIKQKTAQIRNKYV